LSWLDHVSDPKMRSSQLRKAGKWFSKQRIGLILGPLLFVAIVLVPTPQSMIDAAPDPSTGAPMKAPLIALGPVLIGLVY